MELNHILTLGGGLVLLILVGGTIYYALAWRLIFIGSRRYTKKDLEDVPGKIVPVTYKRGILNNRVYFAPPITTNRDDTHYWVLFSGRKSRGINWFKHLIPLQIEDNAYLAMEHPGYGDCPMGLVYPFDFEWNFHKALVALGQREGSSHGDKAWWNTEGRSLSVAGYSIGAAMALKFAMKQPVEKIILFAPFTSLKAIVRNQRGNLAARMLPFDFDNVKAIRTLLRRPNPPEILIVHDPADPYVPFAMSKRLTAIFPEKIRLIPVENGGHDHLLREMSPDFKRSVFSRRATSHIEKAFKQLNVDKNDIK